MFCRVGWHRSDKWLEPHAAWRYTLMSGLIPALPLAVARPFLPESPAWQAKRAAGTLRRPSIARAVCTRVAANDDHHDVDDGLSFGVAFGAIQQIPQIVSGGA